MGGGMGLDIPETHVLAKSRQWQPLAGQHAQAHGAGLEELPAGQRQAVSSGLIIFGIHEILFRKKSIATILYD